MCSFILVEVTVVIHLRLFVYKGQRGQLCKNDYCYNIISTPSMTSVVIWIKSQVCVKQLVLFVQL